MIVLVVFSCLHWHQHGLSQLKNNWTAGQAPSAHEAVQQVFNGFCLGMLGLTGFECMSMIPSRKFVAQQLT